jgi:hypothetical protein
MGGERARAELAAFEAWLAKCIANALVAELQNVLRPSPQERNAGDDPKRSSCSWTET